MAYGDFKDLNRRTAADKVLCDKAFNIAKDQNMIYINVDLLEWFINFLIEKTSVSDMQLISKFNKGFRFLLHELTQRKQYILVENELNELTKKV